MTHLVRVGAGILGLVSAVLLTGCVGGPTYGTSKTTSEQLIDDLGSMVSFEPTKKGAVNYQPRPSLVVPANKTALVQPQTSLAGKDNPNWVESPEEARKRLVAEADAHADDPNYTSPLNVSKRTGVAMTEAEKFEAFRAARRAQTDLSGNKRRYLSDPPLDYRTTDQSALTDLGEPEKKKEERRKKEAEKAGTGKKWWQF
jgi:hypothetical protein